MEEDTYQDFGVELQDHWFEAELGAGAREHTFTVDEAPHKPANHTRVRGAA